MCNKKVSSDFLHALFVLKSLLGAEFSKSAKSDTRSLSMAEYVLMKQVSDTMNLTQIREYLAISKAAVSQMLSSLEKRGYLTREIDQTNRRNLIVSLTPAGQAILREKDEEADSRFEKIIAEMGEADTREFIRLIEKMNDALKASTENRRNEHDHQRGNEAAAHGSQIHRQTHPQ